MFHDSPLSGAEAPTVGAVPATALWYILAQQSGKDKMVWGEEFGSLHELQVRLNEYVWRHDDERLHSTPDYMSPVEFRLAGLSL